MAATTAGKKLVHTKAGLRMININQEEASAFDTDSPLWQPDNNCPICKKCGKRFTYMVRKHHCRRCGHVFCNSCCATKMNLPRIGFVDPQRVCVDCLEGAKKELDLCEKHIPVLLQGGEFMIDNRVETSTRCQLSSFDHRELQFSGKSSHEAISLKDVTYFQCVTDSLHQNRNGAGQLVGVNIKYVGGGGATKELKLNVTTDIDARKQSMLFLNSLQKAMSVIFETNN